MSKIQDEIAQDSTSEQTSKFGGTLPESQDDTNSEVDHNLDLISGMRTGPLTEAKLFGRQTPPASEATTHAPHAAHATHIGPRAGSGYRAMTGLLCSYALLMVGNGLFQTMIPLRMLQSGYPTIVIGLIQSCYYAGFILGAVFNRVLIDRIGQHRTFVAFSAAASILALAFGAAQSPWTLAVVRLITGFAFMGLYTSIESWLNGTVENEKRGQVFGSYAAINYLAVGAGQFLLNVGAGSGGQQFSISAALFAAAVLPVTLLEGWPVKVADEALRSMPARTWRASLREMMASAPLAVPGCMLAGFINSAFYAMMPVYLQRAGFSRSELAAFMGAALIGALVPQWPMGRLSDKVDRRRLISITASISAALSFVLVLLDVRFVTWVATLAYVAVTFTQYGLIVSHVQDRTQAHHRIAVSALLLVLFSLGGMAGPPLASASMAIVGPSGLFMFNALSCASLALCARRALSIQSREPGAT